MAPRGLSAEEKRNKLLEIFHESKDFFQLKELEKIAPKLKGIVSQSVKETLQSLVDDGLVQTDKIGSSNFFWSFPSQRGSIVRNRLDTSRNAQSSHNSQLEELEASIEREKAIRPESALRTVALEKLSAANADIKTLEAELRVYGACDPVKVEAKRRAVILAHEAAIRWTGLCFVLPPAEHWRSTSDNYSILITHFTRQNGVDTQEIRKFLGINEDYEDIY